MSNIFADLYEQSKEEIETLINENKKLAKANEEHKEKIERYKQAFDEIKQELSSYEFWKLTHIFKRLEE